jgi:hypothetical protein
MTARLGAVALVMLALGSGPADQELLYPPAQSPEQPSQPDDPGDATVRLWRQDLEGRLYYLRSPRHPLLANDGIAITKARIRYFYPHDDGHTARRYRITLWFEGVAPAPSVTFRTDLEVVDTLDELYEWLATEISPIPLEGGFDWPSAIQRMVRTRFIAVGMDQAMVALILGGLEYRVERETLEDGRLREVWRIEDSRRARQAFSARRAGRRAPDREMSGQAAGFYLFGRGKPDELSITFIDGRVAPQQPRSLSESTRPPAP